MSSLAGDFPAPGIAFMYRLATGREPDAPEHVRVLDSLDRPALFLAFFNSEETQARFLRPLVAGADPWLGTEPPEPNLVDWLPHGLPVSPEGAAALADVKPRWAEIYAIVLGDPWIRQLLGPHHPGTDPDLGETLTRLTQFEGVAERWEPGRVRGWVRRRDGEAPVRLALWINGAFASSGLADRARRDVQDMFGGTDCCGYDLSWAWRHASSPVTVELREASSDIVLGRATVSPPPKPAEGLDTLRHELSAARRILERIEAQMPQVLHSRTVTLADYDRHVWELTHAPVPAREMGVGVVLDAWGGSGRAMGEALTAIVGQGIIEGGVVVVVDERLRHLAEDLAVRTMPPEAIRVLTLDMPDRADRLGRAWHALGECQAVLFTDARVVLRAGAMAHLVAALEADPAVVAAFGDEDHLSVADAALDFVSRGRRSPLFKPGVDVDLLCQTPYVGPTLAIRRDVAADCLPASGAGDLAVEDMVLRMLRSGGVVAHVARLVASRREDVVFDLDLWGRRVQAGLPEGSNLTVRRAMDILGADVRALRVRFGSVRARATVIIPSRDRLDLLRPCVESLEALKTRNEAKMEVLVIDHENTGEAADWLNQAATDGRIRSVPFSGAFNWALMNNLAARTTDTDVLVFLNDDTLALAPDWLDELCGQALRPEVGVVGCRLIYPDATIQHAGFVMRDGPDGFLIHDGVGMDGRDGGYMGRHALVHEVPAVTGACMAVSAETFHELGGFDASGLPIEGNDVDLCLRARSKGLRVLYDPYATFYHLESKSRGFSHAGEPLRMSRDAAAVIWDRWGKMSPDPGFNTHFDRTGRPFERLRLRPS